METNVIFDTHACVKRMTEAGVEPHVAEAFAAEQVRILENHIATKADIEQLRAATKTDIESCKNELIKWFTNTLLVFAGIILAGMAALLQIFFTWHSP